MWAALVVVVACFSLPAVGRAQAPPSSAPCVKGVDGLYPLLDTPDFNRYARCRNGKVTGAVMSCRAGFLFSMAFQKCVPGRFLVAFDERPFSEPQAAAAFDPAALSCTKSVDDADPSIYFSNCGGLTIKSQCEKGKVFSLEADACIPNLGSGGELQGKDYDALGFTRLPAIGTPTSAVDVKRLPCSFISTILDQNLNQKNSKFVTQIYLAGGESADFAFEVESATRGDRKLLTGFTTKATIQIFSATSVDGLDINGNQQPGFQVPYVMASTLKTGAGDISNNPKCAFAIDDPAIMKKLVTKVKPPAALATAADGVAPASSACIGASVVGGLGCAGGIACAIFSFGVCGGAAVGACASGAMGIVNNCASRDTKCFPADATVQLIDGSSKRMDQVVLGDQILTRGTDGSYRFSDVYLLGHVDHNAVSEFVTLRLDTQHVLHLSLGHFIPTLHVDGACAASLHTCSSVMKRAQDVKVGDSVWAQNSAATNFTVANVQSTAVERKRGLFNPFTLSGDLVVNGVLASAHSEWFLEQAGYPDKYAHHIPGIYQTVMAPARFAYHVGGASVVEYLDSNFHIVESVSFY